MRWGRIRGWLLPGAAEKDEGFRQEILSASHRGLRVVGIVEAGVAVLCLVGFMQGASAIGLAVVAATTLGIAGVGAAYPHNRLLALISCGAASMIAVDAIM